MARPTRAEIDFDALRHNLAVARRASPNSHIMAVVKANAYGHGLERVVQSLTDADGFGVACLEEALVIREAGVEKPITLLEGFFEPDELITISQEQLTIALHHPWQIEALAKSELPQPVAVWLKIDTGMHRLGFQLDEAEAWQKKLEQLPQVATVGLMSHLACADAREDEHTKNQATLFQKQVQSINAEKTLANSGGLLGWQETHLDWVRPGLMLYGISPFPETTGDQLGLQPAMTLRTQLISVRELPAGAEIGYGATWSCPESMRVGVAAVGYGDGYPRHAESGTPVLVNGHRAQLIGRVSMDMISLDLRNVPDAAIGDEVILWGKGLPVEEVARHASTIPYELVCSVAPRVRIQTHGEVVLPPDTVGTVNVGC